MRGVTARQVPSSKAPSLAGRQDDRRWFSKGLAAVVTGGKPTAAESIVLEFIFTEIECRSELPGLNPLFSKKRVYRNLDLRPFEHDY